MVTPFNNTHIYTPKNTLYIYMKNYRGNKHLVRFLFQSIEPYRKKWPFHFISQPHSLDGVDAVDDLCVCLLFLVLAFITVTFWNVSNLEVVWIWMIMRMVTTIINRLSHENGITQNYVCWCTHTDAICQINVYSKHLSHGIV